VAGLREDPVILEFGRFKIVRHRRALLADGRPVELGGRAFDTLMALIDARGTVLSKDELMGRVWPDRVVEENNLAAQISVRERFLARIAISSGQWPRAATSSRVRSAEPPPPAPVRLPRGRRTFRRRCLG
jgi:Transcriptional regulatory protein, C terminal